MSGSQPALAAFLDRLLDQPTLYTVDGVRVQVGDPVALSFRLLAWRDATGGLANYDPDDPAHNLTVDGEDPADGDIDDGGSEETLEVP